MMCTRLCDSRKISYHCSIIEYVKLRRERENKEERERESQSFPHMVLRRRWRKGRFSLSLLSLYSFSLPSSLSRLDRLCVLPPSSLAWTIYGSNKSFISLVARVSSFL